MLTNICIEAVCEEIRACGIEPSIWPSGKHAAITWRHGEAERVYHTALTPSDRRAHLNARSDVRRILRSDGLLGTEDAPIETVVHLKNGEAVCNSREIAVHFGKQHKDVLRSIDRLIEDLGTEFTQRNFALSDYLDSTGRSLRQFDLTRDGFTLVAMGFTGPEAVKWKVKYLEAFNAMEAEIRRLSIGALPAEVLDRIARLEGDLNALTDLCLQQPVPEPGFVIIKSYKRRARGSR